MKPVTMSIRMPQPLRHRLQQLADSAGCTPSHLIRFWIRHVETPTVPLPSMPAANAKTKGEHNEPDAR